MSVLNQMLRDLESRRGQSAAEQTPELGGLHVPPTPRARPWIAIAIASLALLALVALLLSLWWQQADQGSASTSLPALPGAESSEPSAPNATPLTAAPTTPNEPPFVSREQAQNARGVIVVPNVARPTPSTAALPVISQARPLAQEQAPPERPLSATQTRPTADGGEGEQALAPEVTERPNRVAREPERASPPAGDTVDAPPVAVNKLQQARALWQAGQRQQAMQQLQRQLDSLNIDLAAAEQLARWQWESGQAQDAERSLQALLRQHPDQLSAIHLMARLRQQAGDVTGAIAWLAGANEPLRTQDRFLLGALYQQAEQPQAAASTYRLALADEPDNARGWAGLAIALEQSGQTQAAASAWQRALQLPALPPRLQQYGQQRLDQLSQPNSNERQP
jgi:tetratricopeptide (TPR) repeat protein